MEISVSVRSAVYICVTLVVVFFLWKALNLVYLKPKRLERCLREQGLKGNSYKGLFGDLKELLVMLKEAQSKPINVSDDIVPYVEPFNHRTVQNYGRNSFMWFGLIPTVIIMEPEQIRDVFNKFDDFPKPEYSPIIKLVNSGLTSYEGEKWAKHRKIINPSFHLEKLKIMLPTFFKSCNDMVSIWEGMLSSDGSCEVDVWPFLQDLSRDAISRTAFGSSYEEGRKIFQLLNEQVQLLMKNIHKIYIPGWWFLPTATQRRMKKIEREVQASLKCIINKRKKELKKSEATKDDLLAILLESNQKEVEGNGNNKNVGMTIEDVIEECKLFYLAGQETISSLLVWTMVLLGRYPDWQARAREEVLQVFGNQKPDFDGLSHLKIVTMILYEVLRLYPPLDQLFRTTHKDLKLGKLSLPAAVNIILPILLVHHDHNLWGDDVKEFNPERFAEGILKATKGQISFFPFGWGARICVGQNFAMLEVKMALTIILQRFWFELSPAYSHAPTTAIPILQPKYGAHVILRKL